MRVKFGLIIIEKDNIIHRSKDLASYPRTRELITSKENIKRSKRIKNNKKRITIKNYSILFFILVNLLFKRAALFLCTNPELIALSIL